MEIKLPELRIALGFLRQAHDLISGVCSLFHYAGYADRAASLKDITHRISDEVDHVDRKIITAERSQGGATK